MSAELTKYEDCVYELNKLKDLILTMKDNCKYLGKDPDGAIVNSFELGYDANLAFARAISHVEAIESFLKEHMEPSKTNETVELLTWLDAHPATTNRLVAITTKSGANIRLLDKNPDPGDGLKWNKDTVSSSNDIEEKQVSYTIEALKKEWSAYVFMLNKGDEPRNTISFIEFLQIPHEVFYTDDVIYAVEFYDAKE